MRERSNMERGELPPSLRSCVTAEPATSSWLSAVDMMAERTAASITPATMGGNSSLVARRNNTSRSASAG